MLVIKVNCIKLGVTKKLQVQQSMRVEQVIQQVQEKVPGTKPKSNENFGLFLPNNKNKKKSQWLLNSRNLDFYDIENETELLYRDKNRPLKVKMLDGTVKTVMVDDSKSVGHALDIICSKLDITNTEEYSLFIENDKGTPVIDEEQQEHQKRGLRTRIMDKVEEQQNKKVATLKRKAHTDDDTHWLRNEHSLQESGVSDDSLVVIRRRYAYEENINITNPREIQLLYVQSRDAVLDGTHACSLEMAVKFAAYQNQIMYGSYDEAKYRNGQIDMKDCLPKEYGRNKEALKKCKEEHKLLVGLEHLDAKYKYIQLCQGLPTFGVTLFVVKEKVKGKNKLIPRLLGVNKESVMKLDEKTKRVLKMWPLTTLKRWAASPNSFTLDFGAYSEGMYSVQTLEGQQISQLIGGYIDIILKKRTAVKNLPPIDNESGVVAEDHVAAQKKQIIQNQTFRDNESVVPKHGKVGYISGSFSPAKKALITDLDDSGRAVIVLMEELDEENPVYMSLEMRPPSPNNEETGEFDVDAALTSIANANASVIMSSENWDEERNILSTKSAVNTILANLRDLSQHARFVVSNVGKDDEEGKNLLDAARRLADAFKDLTFSLKPDNNQTNEDVYAAINKMQKASDDMIGDQKSENYKSYSEVLIMMTKGVEKATENLSDKTRQLADTLDFVSANKLTEASKKAEVKAQHLTMCTKILIPFINDGKSKLQLANTMKLVGNDVKALSGLCTVATDDDDFKSKIKAAAKDVTDALDKLLAQVKTSPKDEKQPVTEENIYETILNANEKMMQSFEEPASLVKQATRLSEATKQIINGMNAQANTMDDGTEKNKLLSAAKLLADAQLALLAAANSYKANPQSPEHRAKVKYAAVNLRLTTNMATNNALKKALILKLEHISKKALGTATQLVAAGKAATPYNNNRTAQQKFNEARQILVTHNAKELILAVKESELKPGNQVAQAEIVRTAKDFLPVAMRMVESAKNMEPNIVKKPTAMQLSKARIEAESAFNELQNAIGKLSEGQEDCDVALAALKKLEHDLDQASLAAISDTLKPNPNDRLKVLEEAIVASCKALEEELPEVTESGKCSAEQIPPSVEKTARIVQNLTDNTIAFAANLSAASEKQTESLDLAKTVVESVSELVTAVRDTAGNPHAIDMHQTIDEASDNVLEALKDLMKFVNGTMGDIDSIAFLVSSVENAKNAMIRGVESNVVADQAFVVYQDKMVKALKAIARGAHDMVGKAQTKPKELSAVSDDLYTNFNTLADQTKYAVVLTNEELGKELIANVQELGNSCSSLINSAGQFQVSSDDFNARQSLSDTAKDVSVQVAKVLSNLQRGSVGTQQCINAVSYLDGLIGDIDTTVMFAHAGTLDPEDDKQFPEHKENILNNAQKLLIDTKALVASAQQSQEQLAGSVTEVLKSSTKLIDSVKLGSSSLGIEDKNGQILLLNAVKDVAKAMSELINNTKIASGMPSDHPSTEDLNTAAKHMCLCLSNLLKTVRNAEDENLRSTNAIESTINAIKQAVIHLQPDDSIRKATAEDLVRATKGVTLATAKTVAAGTSLKQADIIEATNLGRKQCIELMEVAQAAACTAPTDEIKSAVIRSVKQTSHAYCQVLSQVNVVIKTPAHHEKQKFAALSKNVAASVGKVVEISVNLKGDDYVDPEDPNVIAENELLDAAASIEAAAKKLALLQPRKVPREADETLNFEEQILQAAKSITAATGMLVKAATAAQRELVESGIARLVADATGSLCEAANAAVLGNASQEKLVASAQAVSASTAQLLLACRVKADPFSKAQKRLQAAGGAVKNASDKLVKAAKESMGDKDETDVMAIRKQKGGKRLGKMVEQIEAREDILKKERELAEARRRYERIQMSQYQAEEPPKSPVWESGTSF